MKTVLAFLACAFLIGSAAAQDHGRHRGNDQDRHTTQSATSGSHGKKSTQGHSTRGDRKSNKSQAKPRSGGNRQGTQNRSGGGPKTYNRGSSGNRSGFRGNQNDNKGSKSGRSKVRSRDDNRSGFRNRDNNRSGFRDRDRDRRHYDKPHRAKPRHHDSYRPRYDRHRYHKNFHSKRRYHHGHYHWPRGYRYHRWTYGDFIPMIFFGDRYRIVQWWRFGLMPPPPGTMWVRYGPDALLVDEYNREIIRVVYRVFY